MKVDRYVAIIVAIKWLASRGVKTEGFMNRAIDKMIKDLYYGEITKDEFDGRMFDLIDDQMRRAFNEGMRKNGLDPVANMTDAWRQIYQDKTLSQVEFIDKFSRDILNNADQVAGYDKLLERANMWSNQYPAMVNEAKLVTAYPKDRYQWHLGATEEHCSTCAALDGQIHSAQWWLDSGYHPGNPPNPALECGGWRCDCTLEYTDELPDEES